MVAERQVGSTPTNSSDDAIPPIDRGTNPTTMDGATIHGPRTILARVASGRPGAREAAKHRPLLRKQMPCAQKQLGPRSWLQADLTRNPLMSSDSAASAVIYGAVYIESPHVRRVWFEARSEDAARELCARWSFGYDGPSNAPKANPIEEAYHWKKACQVLGGISYKTLTRWVTLGKVERVSNCRRLMITRESVERGDWKR